MELPKSKDVNPEALIKFLPNKVAGRPDGWITVGEKEYFLPKVWETKGPHLYDFEARSDDTWIVTFPRSGTTWSQELIWMVKNDMDYEAARKNLLVERFPFLELSIFRFEHRVQELLKSKEATEITEELLENLAMPNYEKLRKMTTPRYIKTHLPLTFFPNLLQSGCKVVYVARNPKDALVSFYHFHKSNPALGFQGEFADYLDLFLRGQIIYCPYWEHIKEGWAARHNKNVLFLFYEEMSKDLPAAIRKVSNFFGKSYSNDQVAKLAEYLRFDNFKNNSSVNSDQLGDEGGLKKGVLIREGKVKGWHKLITPEMEAKIDEWTKDNLKDCDIEFPYLRDN